MFDLVMQNIFYFTSNPVLLQDWMRFEFAYSVDKAFSSYLAAIKKSKSWIIGDCSMNNRDEIWDWIIGKPKTESTDGADTSVQEAITA